MPAMLWSSTDRTNFRTAAGLMRALPREGPRRARGDKGNESIPAVHFAAGRHHPADGRGAARRLCSVPATACLRSAAGRLPNDPDADFLSRRQSGCDGIVCNVTTGAAIRPDSRTEPDDLDELVWELDHHAAVHA